VNVPLLQSARLRLRAPTLKDFSASFAMWSSPVVARYIGGRPHTKEEVWARLLRYIGHWHAISYGYWVIETIESDVYIGEIGFSDYRRDIVPTIDTIPEMGWALAPHAHGKGFAFEAASAALAWRDTALPAGETVCLIDPQNTTSLRLADKLGFRNASEAVYHGNPQVVLWRETTRSNSAA
jgi:RimJ/RimL family protein N-acetyltransferase